VPLRIARGVQNKVLEAMACGRAVVATPAAAAGLNAVPGRHLVVADGTRGLAEASVRVLQDTELRQRLGRQARAFVEHEHNWSAHMTRLVDLVETVAVA
jgi:glycosyltransferase involved in cell wall biosynthesis